MSSTHDALVLPVLHNQFSEVPTKYTCSLDTSSLWTATNAKATKALDTRVFHQQNGPTLSLVSLGKNTPTENSKREAARKAVATGVKAARDAGARSIGVVADKVSDHDAGMLCVPWYRSLLLTSFISRRGDPVLV